MFEDNSYRPEVMVSVPDDYSPEVDYTLNLIFSTYIGVSVKILWRSEGGQLVINRIGRGIVATPYCFRFSEVAAGIDYPYPRLPLDETDLVVSEQDSFRLPILFGRKKTEPQSQDYFSIDVVASVFFMVSRYEEIIVERPDKHERFLGRDSIAYKCGFLSVPIVDLYIAGLWRMLGGDGVADIKRVSPSFLNFTCDVDIAYTHRGLPALKRMLKTVLMKLTIKEKIKQIRDIFLAALGFDAFDPYAAGIEEIASNLENCGERGRFYFIPETTSKSMDGVQTLGRRRVRGVANRLGERGHLVGVHPGYDTWRSMTKMRSAVRLWRHWMNCAGTEVVPSRQHILRWDVSLTPGLIERAGVTEDSTLGYPDVPGFRCGTNKIFRIFDCRRRVVTNVTELPLLVMDVTLFEERYCGLCKEDALSVTYDLMKTVRLVGGPITLLWHNSNLQNPVSRFVFDELFLRIIPAFQEHVPK